MSGPFLEGIGGDHPYAPDCIQPAANYPKAGHSGSNVNMQGPASQGCAWPSLGTDRHTRAGSVPLLAIAPADGIGSGRRQVERVLGTMTSEVLTHFRTFEFFPPSSLRRPASSMMGIYELPRSNDIIAQLSADGLHHPTIRNHSRSEAGSSQLLVPTYLSILCYVAIVARHSIA